MGETHIKFNILALRGLILSEDKMLSRGRIQEDGNKGSVLGTLLLKLLCEFEKEPSLKAWDRGRP